MFSREFVNFFKKMLLNVISFAYVCAVFAAVCCCCLLDESNV